VTSEHSTFVARSRSLLASAIRRALAAEASPHKVREAAESVLNEWDALKKTHVPSLLVPGESELWCAVWTAQHLGDSGHWQEETGSHDLKLLLPALEGAGRLPEGWQGSRP